MQNTGQIIKSKSTERFTVIPNEIIRSKKLSYEQKGMLCFLLSLPSDWVLFKTTLHEQTCQPKGTTERIFKELQELGYIISMRDIDSSGRFCGWNHIVYDTPHLPDNSVDNKENPPTSENVDVGKSAPILKTDNTELNTEEYKIPETSSGVDWVNTPPASQHAEPESENGLAPEKVSVPRARGKKIDRAHAPCVKIYCGWYKERTTLEATPEPADFKGLSELLKKLRKIASLDPGESEKTTETFKRFLESHPKWSKFQQSQIRLRDISSQFQNIMLELEKHRSPEKHRKDQSTKETIYENLKNPDFKYPTYGKL